LQEQKVKMAHSETLADNPAFLLSDFGQKIDLCSRIREILVNYPPGTTVLKEYVQNADDAGSTHMPASLYNQAFPLASSQETQDIHTCLTFSLFVSVCVC
jgi:hypothetical protein